MPTIVAKVDLDKWTSYMLRLGREFMPAAKRGMLAGAEKCIPIMHRRTDQAPPASPRGTVGAYNTGDFKRRWDFGALPDGARIFNTIPYAAVIEGGRRASAVGRLGILSLKRWAEVKLKVPKSESLGVAFAIAKTMQKRPLLPRKVMSGGLDEMVAAVEAEVLHELDVALSAP